MTNLGFKCQLNQLGIGTPGQGKYVWRQNKTEKDRDIYMVFIVERKQNKL